MFYHRTLIKVAVKLTPQDVQILVHMFGVWKRLTALEVLRELEVQCKFSADCLEPLEKLLGVIGRHDIFNSIITEFRVQMIGKGRKVLC